MYITLTPAYGRDYKTSKAVLSDWNENRDFIICCIAHQYDGKSINKEQAIETNDNYTIRFCKQTKIINV